MTMNANPASSARYRRDLAAQSLLADITLISAEELAIAHGYSSANDSFRKYVKSMGISPVPHRNGYYDPHHVRDRLNSVQGLNDANAPLPEAQPSSLVEQRRARCAQR